MRYTLTIVRVAGPLDQDLPVPPDMIDASPGDRFNVWWDKPEDVPLPVTWPAKEIYMSNPKEKVCLFYRVARLEEHKNIIDFLPPDARIRLRIGGKNKRIFKNCLASEGIQTLRDMVESLVSEWGGGPDDPAKHYHADPGWELLYQSLMWIELPNGLTVKWTPWGEDDEDGGHTLEPSFDELTVDEVELRPLVDEGQNAIVHCQSAIEFYTKMAQLIQEFIDLFPKK